MREAIRGTAAVSILCALCVGVWAQGELIVPYTYDDGAQGGIRCQFTDSMLLPGVPRVDIGLGPASVEISGSELFYVRHGWGGWPTECGEAWGWPAMDLQALTAFLLANMEFHLRINGTPVVPDYIRVDPADGKIAWYFEFPAGSFAPGVYIFEGRWVRRELDISGCLSAFELPDPDIDGSLLLGSASVKNCLVSILNQ
jgi:hypothetical protein